MLWQDSKATHSLKDYAYWDIDYIKAGLRAPGSRLSPASKPGLWPWGSAAIATYATYAGFHLARREGLRPSKWNFPPQWKGPTPSGLTRLCNQPLTMYKSRCYDVLLAGHESTPMHEHAGTILTHRLALVSTCRPRTFQEWSASNRSDPSTPES